MNEVKIRQTLSLSLVIVLIVGLFSVVALSKTNQDVRQNASGESVQLQLTANEASSNTERLQTLATSPGKIVNTLVEVIPGTANVSAVDFILTYDPAHFEYVSTELFSNTFGVLLKKEINPTEGKIRLAIGKQPGSTATGNQKLVAVNFRVKEQLGTTNIGVEELTTKIAAIGSATNVYQGPTTPIGISVGSNSTTPEASLQMRFKFAGIPVENNPHFLPEAARTQLVTISLQNIATGEITTPIAVSSLFSTDIPVTGAFKLLSPLASTTLTTGKYNILLKGPKHQQIRFCKDEQTPDYRCQITDGIDITNDAIYAFDFTKRPLSCGDLPISGANHDLQDGAVRVTDYSFMVGCLSKRADAACVARADCNADGTVTNLDMDLLLETLSTAYDQ